MISSIKININTLTVCIPQTLMKKNIHKKYICLQQPIQFYQDVKLLFVRLFMSAQTRDKSLCKPPISTFMSFLSAMWSISLSLSSKSLLQQSQLNLLHFPRFLCHCVCLDHAMQRGRLNRWHTFFLRKGFSCASHNLIC